MWSAERVPLASYPQVEAFETAHLPLCVCVSRDVVLDREKVGGSWISWREMV